MSNKNINFIERLEEFKSLKENWNGYNAKPIPGKALINARKVCLSVMRQTGICLEVYPLSTGGVQLEYKDYDLAAIYENRFIFIGINSKNLNDFSSDYDGIEMDCFDLCEKLSKIVKEYK